MFANSKAILAGFLSAQIVLTAGLPAYAAEVKQITMEVNQSYYLNISYQIKRVALANPKIADIKVIGDGALNVVALEPGSTALTVWLVNGNMLEYNVTVTPSDKGLAEAIRKAIDLPGVMVEKIGDKILLKGIVKNQREMEQALKIASLYISNSGSSESEDSETHSVSSDEDAKTEFSEEKTFSHPNIVNLLEMADPVQINLEALVLDISSADSSNIGIQYANASDITYPTESKAGSITFGTVGIFYGGYDYYKQTGRLFSNVNAQVQALVQNGKARILSRPNISTLSGKVAKIHIGGELPTPKVSGNGNSVGVEWKDYGIKLNVQPTADSDGNITSRIFTEVSSIDYDHAVTTTGGVVPAIATRKAEAIINVPSGMTMVIGGLLNSQEGKTIKKIPLLGDIPIIGEFFKHTSKTKDKREMMILIKPVIVNENTPAKMTQQMEDYYKNDQKESESRNEVDLNENVPEETEEVTEAETPSTPNVPAINPTPSTPPATKFSARTIPAPHKLTDAELYALMAETDKVQLHSIPQIPVEVPPTPQEIETKQDEVNSLMKKVADKQNEVNELMKQVADKQDEVNSLMDKVAKKTE